MSDFVVSVLLFLSGLFILAVGMGVLAIVVLFFIDISQTKHAIRHNYPVIGRLRNLFENLGVFFRQYFFAMDREEMPFNREQRSWIYRASKNVDLTVPFGSTRDLTLSGTPLFISATFPGLRPVQEEKPLLIGPECRFPYQPNHIFNISAMSFGALSKPAIIALARGAAKAGCSINTGEGGLSPWHLEGDADVIFQIGTAKYGIRTPEGELDEGKLRAVAALDQVRMFEIKLSQGAKPGMGGILPAIKVTEEIAKSRGIPANEESRSPDVHKEATSISELLDFVARIRNLTGKPTGFKLVVGDPQWFDVFFDEVLRRGSSSAPDFITLDGAAGGSGAAPMALIDFVGLPIHESLPLIAGKLRKHGLQERIRIIASGKLINPGEVAWALCAGADYVNSARGFLFALGCIQSLKCNTNACPTGITTHDPRLQEGLDPEEKAERVRYYVDHLTKELQRIAHSCGISDARHLAPHHCRIVIRPGQSVRLDELFPDLVIEASSNKQVAP